MAKPLPYPIGGGEEIANYTFSSDLVGDGWALSGTPPSSTQGVIGWWSGVDSDGSIPTVANAFINGAVLFGWLDGNPFNRETHWTKTLTGFIPFQRLRFVVNATWSLGSGIGGGGSWVGMSAGGVRGTLSGPVFGGPARTFTIDTAADEAGEVEIAIGVENIHPSMNVNYRWNSYTVSTIGFDADPFSDIIIDSAVLLLNGLEADADTLTLTRGGATFDPQDEIESYPYPGRAAAHAVGLHEVVRSDPVVRANAMLTGERQFEVYSPGGAWADHASISGARTYTPAAFRTALDAGVYIDDFVCIWKRQRGDYVAVQFPKALCTKWSGIGSRDDDEGILAIEVHACQDTTAEDFDPKTTPLYNVHTLPAIFEIGA